MKRIMRSFKLNEISAVDAPAQKHARMLIMKRAEPLDKQIEERLAAELADEVLKAQKAALAKETAMTEDDIKKAVDAAVAKAADDLAKANAELAKAQAEIAELKMSDAHKAYAKSAGLSETARAEFVAKSDAERNVFIAANPIEKSLPVEVQKALDVAKANEVILKQLMEDKEVAVFAKRAVGLGLEEIHGEVLRKAYSGDADAIGKLEQLLKGLSEQVRTGKVFAEFGTNKSNAGATAKDEIDAAAEEYRAGQIKVGKSCSIEQAFTKVYTDPAHADLKKRYDLEQASKRSGVAA